MLSRFSGDAVMQTALEILGIALVLVLLAEPVFVALVHLFKWFRRPSS